MPDAMSWLFSGGLPAEGRGVDWGVGGKKGKLGSRVKGGRSRGGCVLWLRSGTRRLFGALKVEGNGAPYCCCKSHGKVSSTKRYISAGVQKTKKMWKQTQA